MPKATVSKKSRNVKSKAPSTSSRNSKNSKPTASSTPSPPQNSDRTGEETKMKLLEQQLKKLQAKNEVLRKSAATKENNTAMICQPKRGVAGNGFNLRSAMELEDDLQLYTAIRRTVRELVMMSSIDCSVRWHRQPKQEISKIISIVQERHSYVKRFPHGWPIEEMIRSSLKNSRAYKFRTKQLTRDADYKPRKRKAKTVETGEGEGDGSDDRGNVGGGNNAREKDRTIEDDEGEESSRCNVKGKGKARKQDHEDEGGSDTDSDSHKGGSDKEGSDDGQVACDEFINCDEFYD